jgi:hypothetical protein
VPDRPACVSLGTKGMCDQLCWIANILLNTFILQFSYFEKITYNIIAFIFIEIYQQLLTDIIKV